MYNADGISLASTKVFDSIETQKIYLCLLLARLTTSDMYSGWSRPLSDEMTLTNSSKSSAQGDCPDGAVGQNCLPIQEAQVQSLVREDLTQLGATKPLHHNYQAHPVGSTDANVEPKGCNHWSPQVLWGWWAPTTEPACRSSCSPHALGSACCKYRTTGVLQLQKPVRLEPVLHNRRHCMEKPEYRNWRAALTHCNQRKSERDKGRPSTDRNK